MTKIYSAKQIQFFREIIVDNFAGGGGASTGISLAIGRSVDIAINHDPAAIAMHMANHPDTEHYCENVWDVDPRKAAAGRPVALVWLSPDCTHHSKARGGKPRKKNIRGLAWVAVRWAATVKPRVIILENVEEFVDWGPLLKNGQPDPKQKARTFKTFVNALIYQGYKVEWRELRACDYGAPTIRKRLFLVARCDGNPIVWPQPTHGDPDSTEVKTGRLKLWRTAAEIIDWSKTCPSIFDTAEEIKEKHGLKAVRPLADNTVRRIAKGTQKLVIDNPQPFIVQVNHGGSGFRGQNISDPLQTVTSKHGYGVVSPRLAPYTMTNTSNAVGTSAGEPLNTVRTGGGGGQMIIAPYLTQYHSYKGDGFRGQAVDRPLLTVDTNPRYGLATAFISKYYGNQVIGSDIKEPLHTVTSKDHNALVVSHLTKMKGTNIGQSVTDPIQTITAGGLHFGEVRTVLTKIAGNQDLGRWPEVREMLNKYCGYNMSDDEILLFQINDLYFISDIGLRMLEPRELFNAQGFPADYIIDRDHTGKQYPKSAQVARCGNAVPPPFAEALVKANLPELCGGLQNTEMGW